MSKNKIVVKKRVAEDIVCWKIDCEEVAPNTAIESDKGISLLVFVDGKMAISTKGSFTVYSLFNPSKEKKCFFGNKKYDNCSIYAIDQSSEFISEWGLGGANAIPCKDKENEIAVDCNAVAYGNFSYKVEDFYSFHSYIISKGKSVITREDMREILRSNVTSIIKEYLTRELSLRGVIGCQSRIAEYAEEIMDLINARMIRQGLTVYDFNILSIDFEPRYKDKRNSINDAKIAVNYTKVANTAARDDISVDAEKTSKVIVPLVRAINDVERKNKNESEKTICPRCGEKNDASSNYCRKCGEKTKK